jgi:hypothetical protein
MVKEFERFDPARMPQETGSEMTSDSARMALSGAADIYLEKSHGPYGTGPENKRKLKSLLRLAYQTPNELPWFLTTILDGGTMEESQLVRAAEIIVALDSKAEQVAEAIKQETRPGHQADMITNLLKVGSVILGPEVELEPETKFKLMANSASVARTCPGWQSVDEAYWQMRARAASQETLREHPLFPWQEILAEAEMADEKHQKQVHRILNQTPLEALAAHVKTRSVTGNSDQPSRFMTDPSLMGKGQVVTAKAALKEMPTADLEAARGALGLILGIQETFARTSSRQREELVNHQQDLASLYSLLREKWETLAESDKAKFLNTMLFLNLARTHQACRERLRANLGYQEATNDLWQNILTPIPKEELDQAVEAGQAEWGSGAALLILLAQYRPDYLREKEDRRPRWRVIADQLEPGWRKIATREIKKFLDKAAFTR